MEVAYDDTKEDIDFINDHKEKVLKATEESNLTGFLLPHLQKLKRANGSSPIYNTFQAAIADLSKEPLSFTLPNLEDDGFFKKERDGVTK